MGLENFSFEPLPQITNPVHFPFPAISHPLGPLRQLPGTWTGKGFNVIWRPFSQPGQDRFLELNVTDETLDFTAISGAIPNRGLLQSDINMFGLTYLDQISDANLKAGLHVEPGIWVSVPTTSDPPEEPTVVRMASIPHGTTILAQGVSKRTSGPPVIPDTNILPFVIDNPAKTINFPEQILATATAFRSPAPQLVGVTQEMVNNPNSVLQDALKGLHIIDTTTLQITSDAVAPLTGGGTSNTSFLQGVPGTGPKLGPNAASASVVATFWIEYVFGTPNYFQLQYSQTVLLNFNGLSWPHVTVSTMRQTKATEVDPKYVDPHIPDELLKPS